jgi:hypothetical protein
VLKCRAFFLLSLSLFFFADVSCRVISDIRITDLTHLSISQNLTPKLRVYTPRLIKNLTEALELQINAYGAGKPIVLEHPIMFLNKV